MDLATRIQDMRTILAVFDNFDDRGLDEQPLAAMQLLRAVDQDNSTWGKTVAMVLSSLRILHANTNWISPETANRVAASINQLTGRLALPVA